MADSLEAFVKPYREHVNAVLDAPLAYAPRTLSKDEPGLNTAIGNLMADIVFQAADSLEHMAGRKGADLALLNHGGIRSIISKGPVTERTAYEVMPFENTIYLATLSGTQIRELVRYLADQGKAHPIAGMQIILGGGGFLESVSIGGRPFDEQQSYRVATSSYLISGGDGMTFFLEAAETRDTGYRIRNAMTDYFKATDTLRAVQDRRFVKEQTP
ncbi:5'-nucleotidase [Robiginitalea sp. M366]|uniref:5'-nucleotidase C-terminal domain-containing protein n=1 Tax=Robiginitalea aestuariiviva TaxID=3036903 RepID=UPI00240D70BD|nr:5'-nucleotidase [Robiginitalea aestuariiviva]MDG1573139.1 5'-nucleotidase [Robiginitalea aestuariiviva]